MQIQRQPEWKTTLLTANTAVTLTFAKTNAPTKQPPTITKSGAKMWTTAMLPTSTLTKNALNVVNEKARVTIPKTTNGSAVTATQFLQRRRSRRLQSACSTFA